MGICCLTSARPAILPRAAQESGNEEARKDEIPGTSHLRPARVPASALVNAASVATLILTTETLVGHLEEGEADPTEGPALGGGAELLGRK